MAQTMFERYGGFATVSRVVSAFYDRVFESERLAGYFDGVDMGRLVDHQTKFISSLMGGPASFTDEMLERAHAPLNIDEAAYNEAVQLLKETLEDFDIDESDIGLVTRDVTNRKRFIVSKG